MAAPKMFIGLAVLALGGAVLTSVGNAFPPCGRKACSDEAAASGLTDDARRACLKSLISDCRANLCSCTGGSPCGCVCGDGLCGPSEDCATCPGDCGTCPTTTTTTSTSSTTTTFCPADHCGDGVIQTACEQCDGEGACIDCALNAPVCCEIDLGGAGTACGTLNQFLDSGAYHVCVEESGGTLHSGSCEATGPCPGNPNCMLGTCQVHSFAATSVCCQHVGSCTATIVQDESESWSVWHSCVYGGGTVVAGTCGGDGVCVPDGG